MDPKTLKALIAEAKKREKKATAAWRKHDNYEDMREMEMWSDTAGWLESKLPQQ
jgi:hypothetical protein